MRIILAQSSLIDRDPCKVQLKLSPESQQPLLQGLPLPRPAETEGSQQTGPTESETQKEEKLTTSSKTTIQTPKGGSTHSASVELHEGSGLKHLFSLRPILPRAVAAPASTACGGSLQN
ncbi:hypothetical protein AV530_001036 [Patagioenas fasciata monilis]|uniref:Uncharacterized protein n=1 Tax=Patagioenas fasciata monilis TaxID=372326 RepID=A0A1V4KT40_PATFA|nr:hypothetical protein AV530_001036 [Patagioenas fasciata monilis]